MITMEKLKTYFALKDGPNNSCFYSWNAPVFLFANENISGYLGQIKPIDGKRVLTVAAGGDHAFEALLAGAKGVDMFDINYLQKHVVELKSKIIKHLSYTDFMRFFFDKKNFFNHEIIRPIWKTFSGGLRTFLLMYYRSQDNRLFRYSSAQHNDYDISQISYIASESEYKKLGQIMPDNLRFVQGDITEITTLFQEKYDLVMLSNIFEYMYPGANDASMKLSKFYNNILCPIADNNLTTDGGQICFHYAWAVNLPQWTEFINAFSRYKNQSIDDFNPCKHDINLVAFPSIRQDIPQSPDTPDIVLTMTQHTR